MLGALTFSLLIAMTAVAGAQPGPTGEERARAARLLDSAGYEPGAADGSSAEKFEAAIREYQADWQLEVTGRLTADLLARLAREHEDTAPRWQKVENQDCRVWNPSPQARETVTWTGGCKDGKADGRGRSEWRHVFRGEEKSSSYEGGRREGKRHGRGVSVSTGGSRYEGEFRDNRYNGRGVFVWSDGDRYEGQFRDGNFHGRGVWTTADGDRYEGEFRDDRRTGRGIYVWANGNRYEGDFVEEAMHGQGTFVFPSGARYEGGWRMNRPNGQGTYVDTAGNTYAGTWRDGCYRDGDRIRRLGASESECGF